MPAPVERHKTSFNVFSEHSNASWRRLCSKKVILAYHRLFVLLFITNKAKVLTLFSNKSYHNTSIYVINKKKYDCTLHLTY